MKNVKGIKKNLILLAIAVIACSFMILKTYLKNHKTQYHAETLEIDSRYKQEISFDIIGLKVPIKQKNTFVRIDDPVLDVDKHQEALLKELGIVSTNIHYTNPGEIGRHMLLNFADGNSCSFIWALQKPDKRVTLAIIEHEKYHAIFRVAPYGVQSLSKRIQELGFKINLRDYEEETAAMLVMTLSIHLQDIPFENFSGSKAINQAKQILLSNYTKPDTSENKHIHQPAGP
jgi:hypothetical protein